MLANLTPQEAISQGLPLPSDCDLVIVIFWSRIGTPLPPQYTKSDGTYFKSGTEWEYENAITGYEQKGHPLVLLYRRMENVQFSPDDPQAPERFSQYMSLQNFFNSLVSADGTIKRGYNQYQSIRDFKEVLETHLRCLLTQLVNEGERIIEPVPHRRRHRHQLGGTIYHHECTVSCSGARLISTACLEHLNHAIQ